MIAFVKEAEALAERGQLEQLRGEEGEQAGRPAGRARVAPRGRSLASPDPLTSGPPSAARVTQLVRGFAGTWKAAVEALSQDVMRSFTNFKNGTSIIQVGDPERGPRGGGASSGGRRLS